MKKALLFTLTIIFSLRLLAEPVSVLTAKKVALNFYFEQFNQFEGNIPFNQLSIEETFTRKSGDEPVFYVFTFTNGGFVMVSAESGLTPVLGYSFDETYSEENQPANVTYWFNQFKNQAEYVRQNKLQPEAEILRKWDHYTMDVFSRSRFNKEDEGVGPLLTTVWNQGWPYIALKHRLAARVGIPGQDALPLPLPN